MRTALRRMIQSRLVQAVLKAAGQHLIAIALAGLTSLAALAVNFLAPYLRPVEPMSGQFNIVVAEFGQLDERGMMVRWADGTGVAAGLAARIRDEVQGIPNLATAVRVQHYPCPRPDLPILPQCRSLISGRDLAERHEAAQRFAQGTKADLVIYGNFQTAGDRPVFVPEFYVKEITGAEELAGPTPLASPLPASRLLPFATAMAQRLLAVTQFSIGLVYMSAQQPAEAVPYFERAVKQATAGQEVFNLFLGTAYYLEARASSVPAEHRGDPAAGALMSHKLDLARKAYNDALAVNREYSRPYIGLGNVALSEFVRSGYSRPEKLREAEQHYKSAWKAKIQPHHAKVQAKIHIALGGVYSAMAQSGQRDLFDQAETEFSHVIREYEQGNNEVKALVAHAYIGMGIIRERGSENFREAAQYYCKGMELAGDDERLPSLARTQFEVVNAQIDPPQSCPTLTGRR